MIWAMFFFVRAGMSSAKEFIRGTSDIEILHSDPLHWKIHTFYTDLLWSGFGTFFLSGYHFYNMGWLWFPFSLFIWRTLLLYILPVNLKAASSTFLGSLSIGEEHTGGYCQQVFVVWLHLHRNLKNGHFCLVNSRILHLTEKMHAA